MNAIDKTAVTDLLCELVHIPSINPNLASQGGHNEMQLARYICSWLQRHGIEARIEEVQQKRPNVYAEIGSGGGLTLCLCAHLDTVDVSDMTISPFEPTIEGKRLYGRGSCDMKGGLAAVLSAAVAIGQDNFSGKVILALVCDEEYASIGADDFVKRHSADACILTEPSDLKMVIAHKGFLWGKAVVCGKSAHGSRWDLGESAITKMAKVVAALEMLDETVLRKRVDPLCGPASMHVSLIEGGTGVFTYASSCTIHRVGRY